MEQNREPRNKSMHLWSLDLWQRYQNTKWGKESIFNKWYWENIILMQKNETGHLSHSVYKNQLKMIKNLNVKSETKTTRGKHRAKAS